ncbi:MULTISPECIES: replication regulatory protein RepA [Enterobacteriaceae]|uniref:replication regulatory protein RepA n=1 Tax=Enterobacteriaceae TaxID=543 RepID=UPI00092E37FE|nr:MULTISPECIES: replication regulatory protein RepA [Enterobacteriaceae]
MFWDSRLEPRNAVTSSSKRAYRKGNPLSEAERQKIASAKKRATHKELKVFIKPEIKEYLSNLCEEDGVTQAEVLEKLIEREAFSRKAS